MSNKHKIILSSPPFVPIFSGEPSRSLWDLVNSAETVEDLQFALYSSLCRCQNLETRVENLEKVLALAIGIEPREESI